LLDVQIDSFEWLIGSPRWREIAEARGDVDPKGGLEEVLDELSPIEDFSGSMSLSFTDPRFDEVKAPVDECKDKDMTYAAPLFVTAEFINNNTGEIKSQTVFMGDFPLMTERGTRVLVDCYANAPRRIERIAPHEVQARRIGHFGFFREQFQATLWQRCAQLLHGFHHPQETTT